MIIKELNGHKPKIGNDCFFAENAVVVGDVEIGDQCSIWYNAVIRGDVHYIRMGNKVNIQDGAVVHCTYQKSPTNIGNNVSVGHNAIVHGCTIHDNVLVGMGAIVMDDCVVESNTIIAAGAVVTQGTHVEGRQYLCRCTCQKDKRYQSTELISGEIERIANNYIQLLQLVQVTVFVISWNIKAYQQIISCCCGGSQLLGYIFLELRQYIYHLRIIVKPLT